MVDIVSGSLGAQGAYDVSFTGGKLVVSGSDTTLGVGVSVSVDEKLVLAAILKLVPAGGTFATIAGMAVTIIEGATASL